MIVLIIQLVPLRCSLTYNPTNPKQIQYKSSGSVDSRDLPGQGVMDPGWTGHPEQLWLPLEPWECPGPGWRTRTGLGAPRGGGRCPCPQQGWDGIIFKVFSNPNHSLIVWRCGSHLSCPVLSCPKPFGTFLPRGDAMEGSVPRG